VVVSADVLAAETDSQADRLASPFAHWMHSIRSGHGAIPYPDPRTVEALAPEQAALVEHRISTRFVGSAATVAERIAGHRLGYRRDLRRPARGAVLAASIIYREDFDYRR
jgi:hypothetical protein